MAGGVTCVTAARNKFWQKRSRTRHAAGPANSSKDTTMTRKISRLVRAATSEMEALLAMRRLLELDNRMLADIGLTRGNIEHGVRWGLWRRSRR